jgi:glycosyltransferase involved in cell wall biosynthesis
MFEWAVMRALGSLPRKPDALYGHFLYPSGAASARCGRRLDLPSFVAVGESSFWTVEPHGFGRARRDFRDITGCVAVSSLIESKLVAELAIPPQRVGVFPNGVDLQRFYLRDSVDMRKRFGFPRDAFIVAFVGHFTDRKGVLRVANALRGLEEVAAVYAGSGPLVPKGLNTLFRGVLPHDEMPRLLSAADVFVLPTKREGCCNAILEALACGLPVVTSDREFNDDIVDESMSIRVDPTDVEAIRDAVRVLRDDPALRKRLSAAALRKAQSFGIQDRAKRMLEWMEAKANDVSRQERGPRGC